MDEDSWIPFHIGNNGPSISHLMFADDLDLFCKASQDQTDLLTQCLQNPCDASGQRVSQAKTKIYFSPNVSQNVAQNICERTGFTRTMDMGRYLGVLKLHQRVTKRTYWNVIEHAQKRLAGWKSNKLCLVGRITLV